MITGASAKVPGLGTPFFFSVNEASCLGWFHAAQAHARGVGVVMCRPIGYEAMCAYGAYTQLAEMLAQSGFDVVRFDYPGTGDSSGDDTQPGRVRSWIDSIVAAAHELKQLASVSRLCLFGLRLGATLAAQAARRLEGVESMVMWAPCASGRGFVRELRAAGASRAAPTREAVPADIDAMGFIYTAQTLEDLGALLLVQPGQPPAPKVLILDRDDMPSPALPVKFREMGVDTRYALAPGYARMMAEPRESLLKAESLRLITDWLTAEPAAAVATQACAMNQAKPGHHQFDSLRETAVSFGPGEKLFGILAEPVASPDRDQYQRCDTAILMLNVGGNYRIGPNRIYVKIARSLARTGYRALRFDLAGLGDSRAEAGFSAGTLYSRDSTPEVRAAIDWLNLQGCKRFYLLGICSGSYVAFQTALADPRVTGQILMNSRLLEWREASHEDHWQSAMQQAYKSSDFYRRQLFRPEVYRRLLRGEVDVGGISKRLWALGKARVKRALQPLLGCAALEDDVLAKVKRLSVRGTDTLMIMAAEDDGRDYVEFHFGNHGRYLLDNPHFRMVLVEQSDHTFSDASSQQFVIATLCSYLETKFSLLVSIIPPL